MHKKMSKKRLMYELLLKSAEATYQSSLIGGDIPAVNNRFSFIFNPRVGDLVMETSTLGREEKDSTYNIGWLLRIEKGGNEFMDKWVLKSLYHGTEFTWQNASFVRVVDIDDNFYEISHGKRVDDA